MNIGKEEILEISKRLKYKERNYVAKNIKKIQKNKFFKFRFSKEDNYSKRQI